MIAFQNGHQFALAVKCPPPQGYPSPFVQVEMAGQAAVFKSVVGKVDTGASRSMLGFATANALGIDDPETSPLTTGTARTATDELLPYYVHRVMVRIGNGVGEPIVFPLRVAFADRVKRNLFGIDWLRHLCLAVDLQAVHFLKD